MTRKEVSERISKVKSYITPESNRNFVDDLAKRIADRKTVRKVKSKRYAPVEEKPDFRQAADALQQTRMFERAFAKRVRDEIMNVEVPVVSIVNAARKYRGDRTVEVLSHMLVRNAVDETTKNYFEKYLGEYGRQLTRDLKEMLKERTLKVSSLMEIREKMASSFGECRATNIIDDILYRVVYGEGSAVR